MQGTAQFIALELLSPPRTEEGEKETHGPHHDLESFLYVLSYAVMKRTDEVFAHNPSLLTDKTNKSQKIKWDDWVKNAFGHSTPKHIRDSRVQLAPLSWFHRAAEAALSACVRRVVSREMYDLLFEARKLVARQVKWWRDFEEGEEHITYDAVLNMLDKAAADMGYREGSGSEGGA